MILGILILLLIPVIYIYYERIISRNKLLNSGFPVIENKSFIYGNLDIFLSPTAIFDYKKISDSIGGSPTYGLCHGAIPVVITRDVKLVYDICVKHYDHFHAKMPHPFDPDPIVATNVHMFNATGERWKRMRAITSRAVSSRNMEQLFKVVQDSCKSFINYIETGEELITFPNIHNLFQNHTSDVIARCVFGQATSMHQNNNYHHVFQDLFGSKPEMNFSLNTFSWCFPTLARILNFLKSYFNKVGSLFWHKLSAVEKFAQLLINYYTPRLKNEDRYDFLQFLKNAEKDKSELLIEQKQGVINFRATQLQNQILSQELLANCRFLAVAGFDTTANTLAFLFHCLSHSPTHLTSLVDEVDSCQYFDYNSLHGLPFMHNCILETLRLYPHASPLHQRRCMSNITIDNYIFKKDVCIIFDTWSIHHDENIWGSNVLHFEPNRFKNLNEEQKKAFMPFGVGPRQCIGMRFALMEIKTTLFQLLKFYQVLPSSSEINMTLRDTGTIWPEFVPIQLKRR